MTRASRRRTIDVDALWTLLGIALLGAFVLLIVDDYPLRTLIAVQ